MDARMRVLVWRKVAPRHFATNTPGGHTVEVEWIRREPGTEPGWWLFGELDSGVIVVGAHVGYTINEALEEATRWVTPPNEIWDWRRIK